MKTLLCEIEFEWGMEFTEAQLDVLRNAVGADQVKLEKDKPNKLDWSHRKFIMDIAQAMAIAPGKFSVERLIHNPLTEQLDEVIMHLKRLDPKPPFNEKCQVVVPGIGLLEVSEVYVEKDCCTEHLQAKLTEGWRIMAVCPQPDQRRPDYVLGKRQNGCCQFHEGRIT